MSRPYITPAELQARVGGAALYLELTDDDGDSTVDPAVESWVIDSVSDLVDGSAARAGYAVELADADAAYLNGFMLDIANYKLKTRRGKASEDDRKTYEDAMAVLEKLANGDFTLPSAGGGSGGTTTANLDFDGYVQQCNRARLADL